MNLFFTEKIGKRSTNFPAKVLSSLRYESLNSGSNIHKAAEFMRDVCNYAKLREIEPESFVQGVINILPKEHTIRLDEKRIWKAGAAIHFKVWRGVPYRSKTLNFAPIGTVRSVQEIKIREKIMYESEYCYQMKDERVFTVEVDDNILTEETIKLLAVNDGFKDSEEFFEYFNGDFTGVIIHWTGIKY